MLNLTAPVDPALAAVWAQIDADHPHTTGVCVLSPTSLEPSETTPHAPSIQPGESDPAVCDDDAPGSEPLSDQHPLELQSRAQQFIHAPHHGARWHITNALWQPEASEKLRRRAQRIGQCCCRPTLRVGAGGTIHPSLARCRDRLCPLCSDRRGRQCGHKTIALVQTFSTARFITLTLKHSQQPLAAQIERLHECIGRLRKTRLWRESVAGGVFGYEVTFNVARGEWHPHVHIIATGKFLPQPQLKACWLAITGDSDIVHIEACHDRAAKARYISRYVAKPVDVTTWPSEKVREYAEAMHGRRLLQTFGTAHNRPLDDDDAQEAPEKSVHVIYADQLLAAERKGFAAAVEVRGLIARMGPDHARAVALAPSSTAAANPCTPQETAYALAVCRLLQETPLESLTQRDFDRCRTDTAAPPDTSATPEPTSLFPSGSRQAYR